MRKLNAAVRVFKNAPWYADGYRNDARRAVSAEAKKILLKMEICDEIIATSISHEFADRCRYYKVKEFWDLLFGSAQRAMKDQWGHAA